MLQPDELPVTTKSSAECETELLRRELAETQQLVRGLRRQLEKAHDAANEAKRAHAKMVNTLTETMRENTTLVHERDFWRTRAQRLEAGLSTELELEHPVVDMSALSNQISEEEANAIRKAMARLHHPDVGGNPDRMKAWNAALDRLGRG
ncbi:hypothetical protein [Candidatus Viridilinea mediisalina]|uniref:Uncharacterized protein n=1 Tax=Candidatus Viridilinea mediisalina TaxID=2024553 RepID=A0A2A6RLL6_9CHLR|nr:hypothetical protein [Candidatus Viridilinea mediisalina]PDW03957.1 hypothetical protein CJ255_06275 [Candidatus Viridilinea mediisalina]